VTSGVDPIQARAHHRQGGGLREQSAFMGGCIHAQGQTRDHAHPRLRQGLGEVPGVALALRCRVAAADDGQATGVHQRRALALYPQQQGWVRDVEQISGVVRIAPSQEVVMFTRLEPLVVMGQSRFPIGRGLTQGGGQGVAHAAHPIIGVLFPQCVGRSGRSEQAVRRLTTHTWGERQAQPIGHVVGVHGCTSLGHHHTQSPI
jgi:hypothetical protein